jgi:predicted phosphodiesterase
MRRLLRLLLGPLLTRLADNASAPDRRRVFKSLSKLLRKIKRNRSNCGLYKEVDFSKMPFIIFSDQHKGNKDDGDDFASNEQNYIAALEYYFQEGFSYINLGDAEELWKYKPSEVMPANAKSLAVEAKFHREKRYYRTFGNHDLTWKNNLDVWHWFHKMFKMPLHVLEGIILTTKINNKYLQVYLTHGHQGDKMSDNNSFSTWAVAHLWRPFQRFLQINVNTPAKDYHLRDKHNMMMYEWSSTRNDLILITGHTHKPVFASGVYTSKDDDQLHATSLKKLEDQPALKPSYFNTGCCCYSDGDITGIEISNGSIALVKWHWQEGHSMRTVLEESPLEAIQKNL